MNSWFKTLLVLSVFFLLTSCRADVDIARILDGITLHPDLVAPIGSANINFGELLTNKDMPGIFTLEGDEITYQYSDSSEFKIPVINLTSNRKSLTDSYYPSPLTTITLPPNTTLPASTINNYLDLGLNAATINNDRIDSIYITSTIISMQVDVTSDLSTLNPSNLKLTLLFPDGKVRKMDGSSPSVQFTPTAFGTPALITLNNIVMITSGKASGIPIQIKVEAKTGNALQKISPASAITYKIDMQSLNYSCAFGYLGSMLEQSNLISKKFNVSSILPDFTIKLANPKIDVSIESNIGTYMQMKIDNVKTYSILNRDATTVYADFDGNTSFSQSISKPAKPGDWITEKLRTFDKDWGHTNNFFTGEFKPNRLDCWFSLSIDSVKALSTTEPNFITSDAKIKAHLKTTVPMYFDSGSYYEYSDSIDNIFSVVDEQLNKYAAGMIDSATLVLTITNSIPIQTTLRLNIIDSLSQEIKTDFVKEYNIPTAKVDDDGFVPTGQEAKKQLLLTITKDQLTALRKAKYLRLTVRVEASDITSKIHFSTKNALNLKVGLYVSGNVKLNSASN